MNSFLAAIWLGLAAGAGFGPVNIVYSQVVLKGTNRDALAFGSTAVLVDMTILLFGLAGVAPSLSRSPAAETLLRVISALVVSWVALRGLLPSRDGPDEPSHDMAHSPVRTSLVLGFTNPVGIALWLAVGSALGTTGTWVSRFLGAAAGDAMWFVCWGAVLGRARARISTELVRGIEIAGSCLLVLAAAWFVLEGCVA